jgi:hypothetical protein
MSRYHSLAEFEKRFPKMDVEELQRWKAHWTDHAQRLSPKVRKIAMKRVHMIESAIRQKLRGDE